MGTSCSVTGSISTAGGGGNPAARDVSPQPAARAAITKTNREFIRSEWIKSFSMLASASSRCRVRHKSPEPVLEGESRAARPTLHVGDTEAQCVGNLVGRETLDVAQHNDGAVIDRQRIDGSRQRLPQIRL